jgi:hydroxyacylglutathione hydrolase
VQAGEVNVLDVRSKAEWNAGHIAGAHHVPLGDLPAHAASLPSNAPLVVHCEGGARSAIAASVLAAAGQRDVIDLPGGFREWREAKYPVEVASPPPVAV